MTDLNKDSEKDNSNSSSDKLLLARNLALVKNESESKSDGATNATIAHDEHVGESELEETPSIGDVGEDEDTNDAVERAAEERDEHEARVPRVVVRHGTQAHKHEDDRLHDTSQHLENVLDCGVWLFRYVKLDVLFHEHAAKCYSRRKNEQNIIRLIIMNEYIRQDSWGWEHFGSQIGQIRIGENDKRLENRCMLSELGSKAGDEAKNDANEHTAERHDKERRASEENIHRDDVLHAHVGERVEHSIEHLNRIQPLIQNEKTKKPTKTIVTYHRNGVVEQRFTENNNVKHVIDMNLYESGQHGHRIDGRDERGEDEAVQHLELDSAVEWREWKAP